MANHWIMQSGTDTKGAYSRYQRVPAPPTGSLVLAEEIDGLTPSKAAVRLRTMYGRVSQIGDVIICRKEATE